MSYKLMCLLTLKNLLIEQSAWSILSDYGVAVISATGRIIQLTI